MAVVMESKSLLGLLTVRNPLPVMVRAWLPEIYSSVLATSIRSSVSSVS